MTRAISGHAADRQSLLHFRFIPSFFILVRAHDSAEAYNNFAGASVVNVAAEERHHVLPVAAKTSRYAARIKRV